MTNYEPDWPNDIWFLLAICLLAVLFIGYLLCSSRVLGWLISRPFITRRFMPDSAVFSVKAVWLMPLGGKIMFRELRYFSSNSSLRVYDGWLEFRWWGADVCEQFDRETGSRVRLHFNGLEWTLFNHLAKYKDFLKRHKERRLQDPDVLRQHWGTVEDTPPEEAAAACHRGPPGRRPPPTMFERFMEFAGRVQIDVREGTIAVGAPPAPGGRSEEGQRTGSSVLKSERFFFFTAFRRMEGSYFLSNRCHPEDLYRTVLDVLLSDLTIKVVQLGECKMVIERGRASSSASHPPEESHRDMRRRHSFWPSPMQPSPRNRAASVRAEQDQAEQDTPSMQAIELTGIRQQSSFIVHDTRSEHDGASSAGDGAISRGVRALRNRGRRAVSEFMNEARLAWFGDGGVAEEEDARRDLPQTALGEIAQTFGVLLAPSDESATAMRFIYYQDQPGVHRTEKVRSIDDLPKMQLEVDVYADRVRYGPFIDLIRYRLQQVFLPWDFRTWSKYQCKVGQTRPYGVWEMSIRFRRDTVLEVPWRQKAPFPNPPTGLKSAGGQPQELCIRMGKGSRIVQRLPYVELAQRPQQQSGLRASFDSKRAAAQPSRRAVAEGVLSETLIEMVDCAWRTTVNAADWITAARMRIYFDLLYPSEYVHNEMQYWDISMVVRGGAMWYTTEHLNFLYDLMADWSNSHVTYLGEPFTTTTLSDTVQRGIPYVMRYEVFWDDCFDFRFIVNDHNIIAPGQHNSAETNAVLQLRAHEGSIEYAAPYEGLCCLQENEFPYKFAVDFRDVEFHLSLPSTHEATPEAKAGPSVFATIERAAMRGDLSSVWPNVARAQGNNSWQPARDHRPFLKASEHGGMGALRPGTAPDTHGMADEHRFSMDFEQATMVLFGYHMRYLWNWWCCYFGEECSFVDPECFALFKGWGRDSGAGRNLRYIFQQWQLREEAQWKYKNVLFEFSARSCQLYFPLTATSVTVFQAEAQAAAVAGMAPADRGLVELHPADGKPVVRIPGDEVLRVLGEQSGWARVRRERQGWVRRRELEAVMLGKRRAEGAAAAEGEKRSWQLVVLSEYHGQPIPTAAELHEVFRQYEAEGGRRGSFGQQQEAPFDGITRFLPRLTVQPGDELTKLQEDGGAGGEYAQLRWRSVGWIRVAQDPAAGAGHAPALGGKQQQQQAQGHRPHLRYRPRQPGFWRVESSERKGTGYEGSHDFADISFYSLSFTYSGGPTRSDMTASLSPVTLRVLPAHGGSVDGYFLGLHGVDYNSSGLYHDPAERTPFLLMFNSRTRISAGGVAGHLSVRQVALLEQLGASLVAMLACKDPALFVDASPGSPGSPQSHPETREVTGGPAMRLAERAVERVRKMSGIKRSIDRQKSVSWVLPDAGSVDDYGSSWWKPEPEEAQAFHVWVEQGEKEVRDAMDKAYCLTTADVRAISVACKLGCAGKNDPVEFDGYVSLAASGGASYARSTLNDGETGQPAACSTRNTTARGTFLIPQVELRLLRERGVTAGGHGEQVELGSLSGAVRVRMSEARRWASKDAHEHFQEQKRFLTSGFEAFTGTVGVELDAHAPETLKHQWPLPELAANWRPRGTRPASNCARAESVRFLNPAGVQRRFEGDSFATQTQDSTTVQSLLAPPPGPLRGRRRSAPAGAIAQNLPPVVDGEHRRTPGSSGITPFPARSPAALFLSPPPRPSPLPVSDAMEISPSTGGPQGEAQVSPPADTQPPPSPHVPPQPIPPSAAGAAGEAAPGAAAPAAGPPGLSASEADLASMRSCCDDGGAEQVTAGRTSGLASGLASAQLVTCAEYTDGAASDAGPPDTPRSRAGSSRRSSMREHPRHASAMSLPPIVPLVSSRLELHRPPALGCAQDPLLRVTSASGTSSSSSEGGDAETPLEMRMPHAGGFSGNSRMRAPSDPGTPSDVDGDGSRLDADDGEQSPLLGPYERDMVKGGLRGMGAAEGRLMHGQGEYWGDARFANAPLPGVGFELPPQRRGSRLSRRRAAGRVHPQLAAGQHTAQLDSTAVRRLLTPAPTVDCTESLRSHEMTVSSVHVCATQPVRAMATPQGVLLGMQFATLYELYRKDIKARMQERAMQQRGPGTPQAEFAGAFPSMAATAGASPKSSPVTPSLTHRRAHDQQPEGGGWGWRQALQERHESVVSVECDEAVCIYVCSLGQHDLDSPTRRTHALRGVAQRTRFCSTRRFGPAATLSRIRPSVGLSLSVHGAAVVLQEMQRREGPCLSSTAEGDALRLFPDTLRIPLLPQGTQGYRVLAAGGATVQQRGRSQALAVRMGWGSQGQHASGYGHVVSRRATVTVDTVTASVGPDAWLLNELPHQLQQLGELWDHVRTAVSGAAPQSPLEHCPASAAAVLREFNHSGATEGLGALILARARAAAMPTRVQRHVTDLPPANSPGFNKSTESFERVASAQDLMREMEGEEVEPLGLSGGAIRSEEGSTPTRVVVPSPIDDPPPLRAPQWYSAATETPRSGKARSAPRQRPGAGAAVEVGGVWSWLTAGDRVRVSLNVDQVHGGVLGRRVLSGEPRVSHAVLRHLEVRWAANDPSSRRKAAETQEPGDESVWVPVSLHAQLRGVSASASPSAVAVLGDCVSGGAHLPQQGQCAQSPARVATEPSRSHIFNEDTSPVAGPSPLLPGTVRHGRREYLAWVHASCSVRHIDLEMRGDSEQLSSLSVQLPAVRLLATNRPHAPKSAVPLVPSPLASGTQHRPSRAKHAHGLSDLPGGVVRGKHTVTMSDPIFSVRPLPPPPGHRVRRSDGDQEVPPLASTQRQGDLPQQPPPRPAAPWVLGIFAGQPAGGPARAGPMPQEGRPPHTRPVDGTASGLGGSPGMDEDAPLRHLEVSYRCEAGFGDVRTVFTLGVRALNATGIAFPQGAPSLHGGCEHPTLSARDGDLLRSRQVLNLWQGMMRDWTDAVAKLKAREVAAPDAGGGSELGSPLSPAPEYGAPDEEQEGAPPARRGPAYSVLTVCVEHLCVIVKLPLSKSAPLCYKLRRLAVSDVDTGEEHVLRLHVHPSVVGLQKPQGDSPHLRLPGFRLLYARGGAKSRLEVWVDRVETHVSTHAVDTWLRLYRLATPGVLKWLEVGRSDVRSVLRREALERRSRAAPPIDLVGVIWAGVRLTGAGPSGELVINSGMGAFRRRVAHCIQSPRSPPPPAPEPAALPPAVVPRSISLQVLGSGGLSPERDDGGYQFPRRNSQFAEASDSPFVELPKAETYAAPAVGISGLEPLHLEQQQPQGERYATQWYVKLPHVSAGLYDPGPAQQQPSNTPRARRGGKDQHLRSGAPAEEGDAPSQIDRPRLRFRWWSIVTALSAGNVHLDAIQVKARPSGHNRTTGSGDGTAAAAAMASQTSITSQRSPSRRGGGREREPALASSSDRIPGPADRGPRSQLGASAATIPVADSAAGEPAEPCPENKVNVLVESTRVLFRAGAPELMAELWELYSNVMTEFAAEVEKDRNRIAHIPEFHQRVGGVVRDASHTLGKLQKDPATFLSAMLGAFTVRETNVTVPFGDCTYWNIRKEALRRAARSSPGSPRVAARSAFRGHARSLLDHGAIPSQALQIYFSEAAWRTLAEPEHMPGSPSLLGPGQGLPTRVVVQLLLKEARAYFSHGVSLTADDVYVHSGRSKRKQVPPRLHLPGGDAQTLHPWKKALRGQGGGMREEPGGGWWHRFGSRRGAEFASCVGGLGVLRPAKEGEDEMLNRFRVGDIQVQVRARCWSDRRVEVKARCTVKEGPVGHIVPSILTHLEALPADFTIPPELVSDLMQKADEAAALRVEQHSSRSHHRGGGGERGGPRGRPLMDTLRAAGAPPSPREDRAAPEDGQDWKVEIELSANLDPGTLEMHSFRCGSQPHPAAPPQEGRGPSQGVVFAVRTPRVELRAHFGPRPPPHGDLTAPVEERRLTVCLCVHSPAEPVVLHPVAVWFASELSEWRKQWPAREEQHRREIVELLSGLRICLKEGLRQIQGQGGPQCRLMGSHCLYLSLDDQGEVCINGIPLLSVLLPRPAALLAICNAAAAPNPGAAPAPATACSSPAHSTASRPRPGRSPAVPYGRAKRVRLLYRPHDAPSEEKQGTHRGQRGGTASLGFDIAPGLSESRVLTALHRELRISTCWSLQAHDERGARVHLVYEGVHDGHSYTVRTAGLGVLVSLSVKPICLFATVVDEAHGCSGSPVAAARSERPELVFELGTLDVALVRGLRTAEVGCVVTATLDKAKEAAGPWGTHGALRVSVKERRGAQQHMECLSFELGQVSLFATPDTNRATVHVRAGQERAASVGPDAPSAVRFSVRARSLRHWLILRNLWRQKWDEAAAVLEEENKARTGSGEAAPQVALSTPAGGFRTEGSSESEDDEADEGSPTASRFASRLTLRVDYVVGEFENMRMSEQGSDGVCRDKFHITIEQSDALASEQRDKDAPRSEADSSGGVPFSGLTPPTATTASAAAHGRRLSRAESRQLVQALPTKSLDLGVGRVQLYGQGSLEIAEQELTNGLVFLRYRCLSDPLAARQILQAHPHPFAKVDISIPGMSCSLRSEHYQVFDFKLGEERRALGSSSSPPRRDHAARLSCSWWLKRNSLGGAARVHTRSSLSVEKIDVHRFCPALVTGVQKVAAEATRTWALESAKAAEQLRPRNKARGRARGAAGPDGRRPSAYADPRRGSTAGDDRVGGGAAAAPDEPIPFLGCSMLAIPRGQVTVTIERRFRVVLAADKELHISARGGPQTPAIFVDYLQNLRQQPRGALTDVLRQLQAAPGAAGGAVRGNESGTSSPPPPVPKLPPSRTASGSPETPADEAWVGRIDRLARVLVHDWSVGLVLTAAGGGVSDTVINILSAPGTSLCDMETNQFLGDPHIFYDFASQFHHPWELGMKGRSITPDIQQLKSWSGEFSAPARLEATRGRSSVSLVPLPADPGQERVFIWRPKERRQDRDDRRALTYEEFRERARRERRQDHDERWAAALPTPPRGDFTLAALPGHEPRLNIHAGGDFDVGKLLQLVDLKESAMPHGLHKTVADGLEALLSAAHDAAAPAEVLKHSREQAVLLRRSRDEAAAKARSLSPIPPPPQP